jgi:hypothetical protein
VKRQKVVTARASEVASSDRPGLVVGRGRKRRRKTKGRKRRGTTKGRKMRRTSAPLWMGWPVWDKVYICVLFFEIVEQTDRPHKA